MKKCIVKLYSGAHSRTSSRILFENHLLKRNTSSYFKYRSRISWCIVLSNEFCQQLKVPSALVFGAATEQWREQLTRVVIVQDVHTALRNQLLQAIQEVHKAAILLQGLLADSKDGLGMKPRKTDVKGERMLVRNTSQICLGLCTQCLESRYFVTADLNSSFAFARRNYFIFVKCNFSLVFLL